MGVLSAHSVAAAEPASAIIDSPGCHAHTLPADDDDSSRVQAMGFTVNFFGHLFNQLYVNNNGNVSFGESVSEYTPNGLSAPGHFPTLAPFWADVDTSGEGSGLTRYGPTQYNGNAAYCVVWPRVGYYESHVDKLNTFQLLIVSRQDTGADNFDFYFNYNQIRWETGEASGGKNGSGGECVRAGYTNGTGKSGQHFELPGSGRCGALLDSNSTTGLTQTSLNSGTKGQFVFQVRNGLVSAAGSCLNLTSCFNGSAAAGLAVGGAALVTFVGLGGVGVRPGHIPLPVHGGAAAAPAVAGAHHAAVMVGPHGGHAAGAAPPPPPPPPPHPAPSHFQEEAGDKVFEAGGTGLELGMQSVEERAALEAMAEAAVAEAVADDGMPGAARIERDKDKKDEQAPPDGAPPPPPPPPHLPPPPPPPA